MDNDTLNQDWCRELALGMGIHRKRLLSGEPLPQHQRDAIAEFLVLLEEMLFEGGDLRVMTQQATDRIRGHE